MAAGGGAGPEACAESVSDPRLFLPKDVAWQIPLSVYRTTVLIRLDRATCCKLWLLWSHELLVVSLQPLAATHPPWHLHCSWLESRVETDRALSSTALHRSHNFDSHDTISITSVICYRKELRRRLPERRLVGEPSGGVAPPCRTSLRNTTRHGKPNQGPDGLRWTSLKNLIFDIVLSLM